MPRRGTENRSKGAGGPQVMSSMNLFIGYHTFVDLLIYDSLFIHYMLSRLLNYVMYVFFN
jgi:hypothetical protein